MINYYLELSMADKKLPITERMRDELCECCKQASNTVVARREKRTYSIIGRKDEYTLYMTLTSRNEVLPNRSLSTLTRRVTANEYMKKLLVGHTPNGSVFRSTLLEEDPISKKIAYKSDTEIVSEIIAIFFEKTMSEKKNALANAAAEDIRSIVLNYLNDKKAL